MVGTVSPCLRPARRRSTVAGGGTVDRRRAPAAASNPRAPRTGGRPTRVRVGPPPLAPRGGSRRARRGRTPAAAPPRLAAASGHGCRVRRRFGCERPAPPARTVRGHGGGGDSGGARCRRSQAAVAARAVAARWKADPALGARACEWGRAGGTARVPMRRRAAGAAATVGSGRRIKVGTGAVDRAPTCRTDQHQPATPPLRGNAATPQPLPAALTPPPPPDPPLSRSPLPT